MIMFAKMHSLGNDFIVIDAVASDVRLTSAEAKLMAHRRFGVGCDQILTISPADKSAGGEQAFELHIFNSDGSESGQCGNGARCVARLLRARGYTGEAAVTLKTSAGILHCTVLNETDVCVELDVPRFEPDAIPFDAPAMRPQYELELDSGAVTISALSLGNPHAVLAVDDVAAAQVAEIGRQIEGHGKFPQRANVGFMQIVDRNSIKLRVYERGVGETSACGSGACAAVVAGRRLGLLDSQVEVRFACGSVEVEWDGEGNRVSLSGPTAHVYDGMWLPPG